MDQLRSIVFSFAWSFSLRILNTQRVNVSQFEALPTIGNLGDQWVKEGVHWRRLSGILRLKQSAKWHWKLFIVSRRDSERYNDRHPYTLDCTYCRKYFVKALEEGVGGWINKGVDYELTVLHVQQLCRPEARVDKVTSIVHNSQSLKLKAVWIRLIEELSSVTVFNCSTTHKKLVKDLIER